MKQKNTFYNVDYQINIYYLSSCRTNLCHTNLCDLEKSCTFAANFTHNPYESITERLAWLTLLNTQYQLGTYSNIARIKGALIEKELIDTQAGNKVVFADPVFALWLRRNKR